MRKIRMVFLQSLLLSLAACRPAVAPVTPEARAAVAKGGPGVQACWVESRGRFGFTASALLVRHPHGDILIDAGNSTQFDAEIEAYKGANRRWYKLYPGSLKPKRSIAQELQAMSVDPKGLRWIVVTHAHLDHLGGTLDLPAIPILMAPSEIAVVERGTQAVTDDVVPAHARAVATRVAPIEFKPIAYEIFDRHADLFGDGSVVVVPLSGHTPGSVGVFVRRTDGSRIFHTGDAVNTRKQIEQLRGRTRSLLRTDRDRGEAERIVARLHAFAEQVNDVLFLPAHERAAWRKVFGEPALACPTTPVR